MNIEVVNEKSQFSIAIKRKANIETLMDLINEGFAILYNYLTEINMKATGAPYICYFGMCGEFEIEIGFPIREEIKTKGELYMSKTYEGKAVMAMHKGAYGGLEYAYGEVMKYIEENKLEIIDIYYDYYINDPSITPEDELLTKIVIPVK